MAVSAFGSAVCCFCDVGVLLAQNLDISFFWRWVWTVMIVRLF
jgi:hypothetical protein